MLFYYKTYLKLTICFKLITDKRCTLHFQNFTQDNRTQGIMEKSQWDLKRIRFQRRRLTRLDDFVHIYQKMHDALLLEYGDKERSRKKVCITLLFSKVNSNQNQNQENYIYVFLKENFQHNVLEYRFSKKNVSLCKYVCV